MAENDQQRSQDDFERLLRVQGLGIQKQFAYLERWKTDVGTVEQQMIAAHQSAITFAQTAVKPLFPK